MVHVKALVDYHPVQIVEDMFSEYFHQRLAETEIRSGKVRPRPSPPLSHSSKQQNSLRGGQKRNDPRPRLKPAQGTASGINNVDQDGDLIRRLYTCDNQTLCHQPQLQFKAPLPLPIYLCKHHRNGVRFFFLVREGLLLHPAVRLVANPSDARLIVYLPESSPWQKTECNKQEYRNKTLVLDEGDGPQVFDMGPGAKPLIIFKRSYIRRDNGKFNGYMPYLKQRGDVLPMTYPVAEAYIRPKFVHFDKRSYEIVCSLRGSNWDPVRLRVRQWVEEWAQARGIPKGKYVAGEVDGLSRPVVSKSYFDAMHHAKLLVTSNPSGWEGDFRLTEAMASGALVLVDHMMVPRQDPFINKHHILYYDNNDKTNFFQLLDLAREMYIEGVTPSATSDSMPTYLTPGQRIAARGYLHALHHHRAANLIDYVLRTWAVRQAAVNRYGETQGLTLLMGNERHSQPDQSGGYKEHGYALRWQAINKSKKQ